MTTQRLLIQSLKKQKRQGCLSASTVGIHHIPCRGRSVETVGHNRIMFGTDTPFHDPSVEIQKVLVSGVDQGGIEKILYHNAAEFFGI